MIDYLELARSICRDADYNGDAGWAIAAALIAIAERMQPDDSMVSRAEVAESISRIASLVDDLAETRGFPRMNTAPEAGG